MARIAPFFKQQILDANGEPLVGGKVYTYIAGTTTPLATYTDQTEDTENTNPIILDANGEADIWVSDAYYKIIVTDADDVVLRTVDQVSVANDVTAEATAAKNAAQAAQAAAETAETNAETAQAAAATSASAASTSASGAATSATNAATSATNAATSASNASTSASGAATSATSASSSASSASTSATLAQDWATKTNASVDGSDYASKAWAIGGTGVTDTATRGAAKEWAIETASTVDGNDYSAKEWAKGTQTRGAANGGSAKDWAQYTGGTVDNAEYSAKKYAQDAAASATAAATAVSASTGLAEYASEAAYVSANGAAEDGDIFYDTAVDLVKVYANGAWTSLGSGGGGSALHWTESTNSPTPVIENNILVYKFTQTQSGDVQNLYSMIRVPASYVAGSPIRVRTTVYSAEVTEAVSMLAQATLIRTGTDAITSTTNQRTTTNAAIDFSASPLANKPYAIVLDVTSSTGQINGVSVSAGDLILVRLYRDFDVSFEDMAIPVYGTEVTFN